MIFRYGVYGLSIEADTPIDGALAADFDTPDVRVHLQAMPPFAPALFDTPPVFDDANVAVFRHRRADLRSAVGRPPVGRPFGALAESPDQTSGDGGAEVRAPAAYGFRYADGTQFVIDGSTIWSTFTPTSTREDTATYLLGPILAFVLRRRGTLSLHASAVVLGGRAVAVAAPPGGGKSTTAAAFADRGIPVLTDDVLPIAWRDGVPHAVPGYPRVRLWPETVGARYGAAEALPLLTPTWSKRYLDVSANFPRAPLPLAAIVILRGRAAGGPRLEPLGGHEAAMQLVANSSMALYLEPEMRVAELDDITALIERVPLFAAHPSDDLGRIGELCDAIAALPSPS